MLKWMMHWTGRSLLVNQPDDFDQSRDLDCSNSPNMYRSMYVSPYTPCMYTYIYTCIHIYTLIHMQIHVCVWVRVTSSRHSPALHSEVASGNEL